MYRKGSTIRQRASRLTETERRERPKKQHSPCNERVKSQKPVKISLGGVGTEIKSLFSRIGIDICNECKDKAKKWDRLGIDGCREKRVELVAWLIQQATEKKISIYESATAMAVHEPLLSLKIAALKTLHPLTDISELAAGAIVDYAIDAATRKAAAHDIDARS